MVTYQADSPSRMCDGSLDEAARMVERSGASIVIRGFLKNARTYKHASQAAVPTHVHIDATSGLVWRTVLRPHTSAPSVRPSPSPHACPCTTSHHLTFPSHPISLA
jgi:hypothetical protein